MKIKRIKRTLFLVFLMVFVSATHSSNVSAFENNHSGNIIVDNIIVGSQSTNNIHSVRKDNTSSLYLFKDISDEIEIQKIKDFLKGKYEYSETTLNRIIIEKDLTSPYNPTFSRSAQTKLGSQMKTVIPGRAGNQYKDGVSFQSGGSIYWSDGGAITSVGFLLVESDTQWVYQLD